MVIEFTLLQNFILAIFIVSLFVLLVILVKKILNHQNTPTPTESLPNHPISDKPNPLTTDYHNVSSENQEYKDIVKSAQKHAKTLLYHSTLAASDMLVGAKKTNEHMEEQLDKVLQGIAAKDIHTLKTTTSQFDKDYQQTLQKIEKQLQEISTAVVEKSQNSYNEKIDEFTNNLLKSGLATQGEVDKKTAELLAKVESEIEEYKKSKLNKVDEDIKNLIQKVYRDVLRVSIPENVHQELIVKSLEEAKKDGMFKL